MITAHYSGSCRQLCGEYIIDHSNFLLAILDGNSDMVALQTLDYAELSGCGIIYIGPDNGTIIPVTIRV